MKYTLLLKKIFFSFICSIISVVLCFLIFKKTMYNPNFLIFAAFSLIYVLSLAILQYIYSLFKPEKKEPFKELFHYYLFLFIFITFAMNIFTALYDFIVTPSTLTLKNFLFFIFYICCSIYLIYYEIKYQKNKH